MDMGGLHAAETEVFDLANLQLQPETYYYIVRLSPCAPCCQSPVAARPLGFCVVLQLHAG